MYFFRQLTMLIFLFSFLVNAAVTNSGISYQTSYSQIEQEVEFILELKIPEGIQVIAGENSNFSFDIIETGNLKIQESQIHSSKDITQTRENDNRIFYEGDVVFKTVFAIQQENRPWRIKGRIVLPISNGEEEIIQFSFFSPVASESNAENHASESYVSNVQVDDSEESILAWADQMSNFEIIRIGSGSMSEEQFLDFLSGKDSFWEKLFSNSLFITVLGILIGGLLLNLTPCVLPMIPINLGIIGAGSVGSPKWRGFFLGATYGGGIAISYGMLGVFTAIGRASFGDLNSSAWFNILIAILFIVLALSLIDVFSIDFSRLSNRFSQRQVRTGSFVAAFFMGSLSALLAGACVAPVVIAVVLHAARAYAGGNFFALLYPLLLGIGMALPWPFAGAGLGILPKPGAWMLRIKYIFALVLIILAARYGLLGYNLAFDQEKQATSSESGIFTNFEEAFEESQKTGKPIFVDFWATWCVSCLHMERNIFTRPAVAEELNQMVFLKYQTERMHDPKNVAIFDLLGVEGVRRNLPLYVILQPLDSPKTTPIPE